MSAPGSSTTASQAGASGSATTSTEVPSLDDLINQITASADPVALNQTLKGFAPKDVRETILSSTMSGGADPLMILNAKHHTLGYLWILSARLNSTTAPQRPTIESIEDFCSSFDPIQARLAPDRVTLLAKGLVRVSEESNNLKYALTPLHNLVTRYPTNGSCLTTVHPIFLRLCVTTGHFTAALPVLSTPITEIDTTLSNLEYNDNLIYHYAGGIVFGALKLWKQAEDCFEICASAPAQVAAAIQLEASKKLVLVQLILYGHTVPPPKYTNATLQRLLKASPYGNFIKAYPKQVSQLQAVIQKDLETFSAEKNLGLIHQAIERAPRWLIKKLTGTYLTLGIRDIGKEVGIRSEDEVRKIVVSMIEADEISATISADGTVTFSDPVSQFSKKDVDDMLRLAQEQSKLLLHLEREMNKNKDYLLKAVKHKDEAGWGPESEDVYGAALGGGGGGGWVEESS